MDKPDKCKTCPGYYTNQGFINPIMKKDSNILLVMEKPVAKDLIRPYSNGYCNMLSAMVEKAGMDTKDMSITYAVKCKPMTVGGKSRDPTLAEIRHCQEAYLNHDIESFKGNLIVPSGDIAIRGTGHVTGIAVKARGYINKGDKHKIIPIVSPAFILEGNPEYRSITHADLGRIKGEQYDREIKYRDTKYNIYPSIKDLRIHIPRILRSERKISVDIETVGIRPETCNIICVGASWSGEDGICIPFLKQFGDIYWKNPEEEADAWSWVYKLLTNPKTGIITQNGLAFDMAVFNALGIPFRKAQTPLIDIIVKYHTLYLELPHNLNFMSSLFTNKQSFKAEMKEQTAASYMINLPDEKLRTYNLDDCTATYLVNDALDNELKDTGLDAYYNDVIKPMQYIVFDMQSHGLMLDKYEMNRLYKKADLVLSEMQEQWLEIMGEEFNPLSPKQVTRLMNNHLGLYVSSSNKLELIKAIQKQPDVSPIVKAILHHRDLSKLRGTYLKLRPDRDGRVRSTFKLHGTLTWRLASADPNLQTLPRVPKHGINVKNIFVASPGSSLLSIDYSQLEARIPAYASRCGKLIHLFDSGKDYYTQLACVAFRREITDKNSIERFNAKTFKLAEGYGANAFTISNHILKNSYEYVEPSYIQEILNLWQKDMPEIHKWHNECYDKARKEGKIYDGFGYHRTLFGDKKDWHQIAFSWPTQTTASGIVNRAMIRIANSGLLERYKSKMILQIHDELMFEIPDPVPMHLVYGLKVIMEEPYSIFGYDNVSFPTSHKIGKTWGGME